MLLYEAGHWTANIIEECQLRHDDADTKPDDIPRLMPDSHTAKCLSERALNENERLLMSE